jgi:hypothetical protein
MALKPKTIPPVILTADDSVSGATSEVIINSEEPRSEYRVKNITDTVLNFASGCIKPGECGFITPEELRHSYLVVEIED